MEIDPKKVHQAMQDAPHDGKDFRHARAAIRYILGQLAAKDDEALKATLAAHVLER